MPEDEFAMRLAKVIELLKMEVIKDEQSIKAIPSRGEKARKAQRQKQIAAEAEPRYRAVHQRNA